MIKTERTWMTLPEWHKKMSDEQIDRLINYLGDVVEYSRRARRGFWAQAWAWMRGDL